jgi:hypothetical protein
MSGDWVTKICFGLKNKVSLFTSLFVPKLQCLWKMGIVYKCCFLNHHAAMNSETVVKNLYGIEIKFPLLLPDLDQTCSRCGVWGGRVTFDIWTTTVQCLVREWQKTLTVSRVMCPLLLWELDQTCNGCGQCGVRVRFDIWTTSLQWVAR